MNMYIAVTLGVAIWGAVFICLLVAVTIETDVARRWNQQWVIDWEARTSRPVDDLLERLDTQIGGWKKARNMSFWYCIGWVVLLAVFAVVQFKMSILTSTGARTVFLTGGAVLGFLMLPLLVGCEIGLNLVESMKRHLRQALGEKLVINSRQELSEMPRFRKEKEKKKEPPKA
jgi:hypothetical protein